MNPCEHPLWEDFLMYATANGVGTDHPDDWKPWWDCFLAGVKAVHEYVVNPRNPLTR
jgi:hypothetical protein